MPGEKVSVGSVEIVSLLDTPMDFDWSAFFPNNSQSDFEPYKQRYPGSHSDGQFRTYAHCYALRSQGQTVLVDTGVGPGMGGHLIEDMNAKGVEPDSVDIVVFTHLHPDHVGWNLTPDRVPTFGKARYWAPQGDWDAFTKPDVAAQSPHIGASILPLHEDGRIDLFSGEKAVTPEITTMPTPGHTPGHTSLIVSSGGERAIITGDLAHHPAQVDQTDWCSGFDGNPQQAIDSRSRVFERLESEGLVAAICHFPDPGFGKLIRLEGKRIFQAL